MASDHVHVELDIERGDEPIRGTVHTEERTRQFSGWLALIAELDGLRRSSQEEDES